MSLAATFLGGAKSRLLPASIPFRFFAASVVFHVVAWLGLLAAANDAPTFRGGLGPALAALHALTLGVLVSAAIGASVQLLPVATRRPLAAVWPIRLVFWITVPAIAVLIFGMFAARIDLLIPAAIATAIGLLLYCGLLADNLRRARNVPVVAAYGWAALAAFVLVVVLGVLLAVDDRVGTLADHDRVALAHLILGGVGFMGLLALGFSNILIPMFALSGAPPQYNAILALVFAIVAIALAAAGAIVDSSTVLAGAALSGFIAALIHVRLMIQTLRSGMRKRLGLSFILIRASWAMLVATPLFALGAIFGVLGQNGPTLFAFILFAGWLLTFLLGIMQRILPFLASMHAPHSGSGSTLSDVADSMPLRIHALCHGIAVIIVALAIVIDAGSLMRLGATLGFVGALAFAWFAANIIRRIAGAHSALPAATPKAQ